MSSGAQAQLAASQVATQAQAEANRNALDFAKQVFAYEQQIRNPYMNAGNSALDEELQLLGLAPVARGVGSGSGHLTSTTGRVASGSGGGGGSTGIVDLSRRANNPYDSWLQNERNLGRSNPDDPTAPPPSGTLVSDTGQQFPLGAGVAQGGTVGGTVDSSSGSLLLQAPDGTIRMVPASLAPFFQERGMQVVR